jgi:nicotinamidase-related amidase
VQNDSVPAALAVPRGDEVVPIVNRLAENFRSIVARRRPALPVIIASAASGARFLRPVFGRRPGFAVVVIDDACRGIDVASSVSATWSSFAALGVITIAAGEIASAAVGQ